MMKKILVTGCNGQLGRAIRQEYKGEDVSFINTDVAEGEGIVALDITDVNAVLALVRAERPDVIINCAAHTNVDACEQQWDAAYRINAIGPRNLSIAAREVGAKMIHVSTDYVFEGNGTKPYTEFDEIHPVSAYGKTKAEGEKFVREFADRYFIFRTAWLYGDGKNFVKTMLRLAESHDEVSVVCDMVDFCCLSCTFKNCFRKSCPVGIALTGCMKCTIIFCRFKMMNGSCQFHRTCRGSLLVTYNTDFIV